MTKRKVPHGQEWWRVKQRAAHLEQMRLQAYLRGRRHLETGFAGSQAYIVFVRGSKLYAVHRKDMGMFWEWELSSAKLVGRIYGKYTVLHAKHAPRWLRNWARYQPDIYVLPKLDRDTLATHLMVQKLKEE